MGVLDLPTGSRIQVPNNMRARDVIQMLNNQGFNRPIIYDVQRGSPLSPEEPVGSRELRVLEPSNVGR